MLDTLRRRLTFKNPLFGRKERFGHPVGEVPEHLEAIWAGIMKPPAEIRPFEAEETDYVVIAKGYLEEVLRLCHAARIQTELNDDTLSPGTFVGRYPEPFYRGGMLSESAGLDGAQGEAVREMMRHRFGILEGPPGSGKRLCALKLAIRKQLPMLVIVSSVGDLHQWKRIASDAVHGLPPSAIGMLGGGFRDRGRPIMLAVNKSLWQDFDEVGTEQGLLVIDRCDQASLTTIFKTRHYNCAGLWGLASGPRHDGLTKLMEAYLGPRVWKLTWKTVGLPVFRVVHTNREYAGGWEEMARSLREDGPRNEMIATDLLEASAKGSRCLVVSDNLDHLDEVRRTVSLRGQGEFVVLHSKVPKRDLDAALERYQRRSLRILGAAVKTLSMLSEELKRIDCLFVVAPIRATDHLLGVITKMGEGGMIYEYRDRPAMLRASLRRRLRAYRGMGINNRQ